MAFTIFLGILGALLLISAIGKIASKGTPGKRTLGIILGFTAVACFTLAKTNYDECHALSASSASLPIPEEEMLSQLKKRQQSKPVRISSTPIQNPNTAKMC